MRPRPSEVGPGLAWWQQYADRVLRDACKSTLGLDVELSALEGRAARAPTALQEMDKDRLPFLLQTHGGKAGLFVIDGVLIDALIEQQILGKVMPTPRLDRPITAIDAGLSEGFVRATLAGMTTVSGHLAGLTTRGPEQDRAALRLALGESPYDILSASIDLGPGIKSGLFEIWIPAEAPRRAAPSTGMPNPLLAKILNDCPVELHTRMTGCEASAQQLMTLEVGTVFHLPASSLTNIAVMDCNENVVARGRLGQLHGQRAVRVTDTKTAMGPNTDLAEPAEDIIKPVPDKPAPPPPADPAAFEDAKVPGTADELPATAPPVELKAS
jgi:flagellar motor switch protein FliM